MVSVAWNDSLKFRLNETGQELLRLIYLALANTVKYAKNRITFTVRDQSDKQGIHKRVGEWSLA
jgi:hypothetical protein